MFKKIVAFNTASFAGKKIKPVNTYQFARGSHIAALMVNEFNRAAGIYPIVFLKDGEKYGVYALLGLNPNENLFVNSEGRWEGSYIPAIIRRYPFVLARGQGENNFMIGIDEESGFINTEEGEELVTPDGKPSQLVENAKQYLTELHRSSNLTEQFCKELAGKDLLSPLSLQVKTDKDTLQNIAGCYGINERKFGELSDSEFLEFRKRGLLPLIYAHLVSLSQFERLVRLQAEQKKK